MTSISRLNTPRFGGLLLQAHKSASGCLYIKPLIGDYSPDFLDDGVIAIKTLGDSEAARHILVLEEDNPDIAQLTKQLITDKFLGGEQQRSKTRIWQLPQYLGTLQSHTQTVMHVLSQNLDKWQQSNPFFNFQSVFGVKQISWGNPLKNMVMRALNPESTDPRDHVMLDQGTLDNYGIKSKNPIWHAE